MGHAPARCQVDLETLLGGLAHRGQLVHVARLAARPARLGQLSRDLSPVVAERVPAGGLWSHQAQAVDLLRAGRSVALASATASGKSLCYQLAIAEALESDAPATALLVFPTKALAQDQLRALAQLELPGLIPATYDGDSSPEQRAWVRRHANVILTNPDMLHFGILPNHPRWATFLSQLRFVVLDELHTLRGVFGSHVAHVLRRLRRLAANAGSCPTFCFTSGTIGDPGRLASALCGLDVSEVTDDGSPQAERLLALWNPPLLDRASGIRGRPPRSWPRWSPAGTAASPSPEAGRAPSWSPPQPAGRFPAS
jgi:DEAD/DEAH box helicase domain-containing protein